MKKQRLTKWGLMLTLAMAPVAWAAAQSSALARKSVPPAPSETLACDLTKGKSSSARQSALSRMTTDGGLRHDLTGTVAFSRSAVPAASPARRAAAANIELRGVVIGRNGSIGGGNYGVYSVPVSAGGEFVKIADLPENYMYSCVDDGQGTFFAVRRDMDSYWENEVAYVGRFSTADWTQLQADQEMYDCSISALDVARDPVSGKIYGSYYDEYGLDPGWGEGHYGSYPYSSQIATMTDPLVAVGVTAAGQYYGISRTGKLEKIDKETGRFEVVAQTGAIIGETLISGCVNDADNTFLLTYARSGETGIQVIDLATGDTQLLTTFPGGEVVSALYIVPGEVSEQAPAAPVLEVGCTLGAMAADITLTMPSTLVDGTAATGAMTYTVMAGAETVAEGTAQAGETVTRTVPVSRAGLVEFSATVANDEGSSPRATATCYIGKGAPSAPQGVTLSYSDGQFHLSWEAVTSANDAGYFDPSAVTYNVYNNAGQMLEEGITATSWSVDFPMPDEYAVAFFSVSATHDGKTSELTQSNQVAVGTMPLPMVIDFNKDNGGAANFYKHFVVDANNDTKTWWWNEESARYSYNTNLSADDWLISPAVSLKAGYVYSFRAMVAAGMSSFPERIEVKAGMDPDALDLAVVPPTDVTWSSAGEITGKITPAADGTYYIGFHAISDPDKFALIVYSYSLQDGVTIASPAGVTDIVITPDATGDLSADITFKAPVTATDGSLLSGDVTVKVRCGDREVASLTGAPGSQMSCTDRVDARGSHTYTFTAYDSMDTEGVTETAMAFIGPGVPAAVTGLTMANGTTPGDVTLAWSPVTTDVDGKAIPAGFVTYRVYTSDGNRLLDELTTAPVSEPTFTFHALDNPDRQDFGVFAVTALYRDVEGAATNITGVYGNPYTLPVVYTNSASLSDYLLITQGPSAASVMADIPGQLASHDGDGQCFAITHRDIGDKGALVTGIVDLDAVNPVLLLHVYKIAYDDNNATTVSFLCDGVQTELYSFDNSSLTGDYAWNPVRIDLSSLKGRKGQFIIQSTCGRYDMGLYDRIQIYDERPYDLAVFGLKAPAEVDADERFDITAGIYNFGAETARDYTVALLRDGNEVESRPGTPLMSQQGTEVSFTQTVGRTDAPAAAYSIEVRYADDQYTPDNITPAVTVTRRLSDLPAAGELSGTPTAEGARLSWIPVDEASLPLDVTVEDFHTATPWARSYGDWAFVDVDGKAVGGIMDVEMGDILPGISTASFFVFDNSDTEMFNASFHTFSGTRCLAALYREDGEAVDDWAISPRIDAAGQTVSFMARSYHGGYPEQVEVWYTTGDTTDPADFTRLDSPGTVTLTGKWTRIEATLPAGAVRFAVRSCAEGSFMLLLDHFRYVAENAPCTLSLLGYNLYRDGAKLNDAPVITAEYADNDVADGDHTYHVSAVYNRGESEVSNPVTLRVSGLEAVDTDNIAVIGRRGAISVSGAAGQPVTVAAVDGRLVYTGTGDTLIPAAPGVYLVTVATSTWKVTVL